MALSEMIGQPIRLQVPQVQIMRVIQLPELLCQGESLVAAVYVALAGDLTGRSLVLFSGETAGRLCDILLGQPEGCTQTLGDLEKSALSEIGNVMISSYLRGLSQLCDLTVMPSPPQMGLDMAAALLNALAAEVGIEADEALVLETELYAEHSAFQGYVLVIPELGSLDLILQRLGVL
jgi:chemotaxis protein CheC